MSQPPATVTSPYVLHAYENAVSARRNTQPPWQIPWPFAIVGETRIAAVARPRPIASRVMPASRLARSVAVIASAHARASSSGVIAPTLLQLERLERAVDEPPRGQLVARDGVDEIRTPLPQADVRDVRL